MNLTSLTIVLCLIAVTFTLSAGTISFQYVLSKANKHWKVGREAEGIGLWLICAFIFVGQVGTFLLAFIAFYSLGL